MAIQTRLVGRLGGGSPEVREESATSPATVRVPAGWGSCWVVANGTGRGGTFGTATVTLFGRSTTLSVNVSAAVGGGVVLTSGQTSQITGTWSGTLTYIRMS